MKRLTWLVLLAACGSRSPLPTCVEGALVACYTGPDGTLDVGSCRAGAATCGALGEPGACVGAVLPNIEQCNSLDDDCNGVIDDGCTCTPGELVTCYDGPPGTLGNGGCVAGTATCNAAGAPGPCLGEVLPAPETCNGFDDDCTGIPDEGCACLPGELVTCYDGPPQTLGNGPCAAGTATCTPAGQLGPCLGQTLPGSEVCNGLDDDCTGIPDEGCACLPGEQLPCYDGPPGTLGVGACKAGVATCGPDGQPGLCFGQTLPLVEACNGLDDDCDGTADEGVCPMFGLGCADGTREGFLDESLYPSIAGCSGGFGVAGLLGGLAPQCNHQGGNSGPLPSGVGCSAEDLCAVGFHVCKNEQEVDVRSPTGCVGAAPAPGLFFVSRQSGPGCGICALGSQSLPGCDSCQCVAGCIQTDATANDLFGCGSAGDATASCGVLDRFSHDQCGQLPAPWSCGGDGCDEAHVVVKPGPDSGGALCCQD